MKIETSHKRMATTLLTSMTDVVFLLLIFITLASNFVIQSGINIRLPGSTSGVKQNLRALEIVYNSKESIVFNDIQMDMTQFMTTIPYYFKSNEQVVRIIADKNTSIQDIISLMDILRNTGFEKITIATQKVDKAANEVK
jgi:biopolymer transport protein ExbD